MLDIIRYIKISAIEKFFYRRIDEKREKEIALEIRKTLNSIFIFCLYFFTSPLLITVAYMTYIYLGNDISPEVAFTTMATVKLFENPMFSLPNAVNELVQIFTSLKRI
jgi:ABC-type multidrug transport system fused ATPase/permease subunit